MRCRGIRFVSPAVVCSQRRARRRAAQMGPREGCLYDMGFPKGARGPRNAGRAGGGLPRGWWRISRTPVSARSRLAPLPLPPLSGSSVFTAGARSLAGSRSLRRTAGEGGAAWEPELGGFSMDFCVLRPVVRRGAPGGGPLAQPLSRGSCFAYMRRRRPICGRPGHSPGVGTGLGTKIA